MLVLIASLAISTNILIATASYPTTPISRYQLMRKHHLERKELRTTYKYNKKVESGLQTVEDYEYRSRVQDKTKTNQEFVPKLKVKDWKFFPYPNYKIVRYNNPPGTPEINLHRKYKFDRQEDLPGIIANDFSIMVYPSIHYYALSNCTTCDVYVIPLDKSLSDIEKIRQANVARRWSRPIFSTSKSIEVKNTFRTITPVDFSVDNSKIVAKEKVGNVYDGIWKTDVLVYDFKTGENTKLIEVREAIEYYWKNHKGVALRDYYWDIFPMGFSTNDPERVIVGSYAYTGNHPIFLGYWSVDYKAQRSELVTLDESKVDISVVGYKLISEGNLTYRQSKREMKKAKKEEKYSKKAAKSAEKKRKKAVKAKYKKDLQELKEQQKQETQVRIQKRQRVKWSNTKIS